MSFICGGENFVYKVEDTNGYTNYIFERIEGYPRLLLVRIEKYDNYGLDYITLGLPRLYDEKRMGAEYKKMIVKKGDDTREMSINSMNVIFKDVITSNKKEYLRKDLDFISSSGEEYDGSLKTDSYYFIEFLDSNRKFSEAITNERPKRLSRILSLFKSKKD